MRDGYIFLLLPMALLMTLNSRYSSYLTNYSPDISHFHYTMRFLVNEAVIDESMRHAGAA